ncbi:MAG: hypothetical protein ACE145_16010 [Terriglobia bacterium]
MGRPDKPGAPFQDGDDNQKPEGAVPKNREEVLERYEARTLLLGVTIHDAPDFL